MKKRFLAVGVILAAAGAAGGFGWYYFHGGMASSSGEAAVYVSSVSSITGSELGITNRYAGVVEPQETVEVAIDSGRTVKSVNVKTGQEVSKGQLLFEYDLSSIQDDLKQAQLDLDRLKNEALSLADQIATLEKEKKQASKDNQLSYTIEIETSKMNLKKNEYDQESKEAEIQKLQNATGNTEVRSEIAGVIQKIDTSKMSTEEGDYLDEGSMDTSSYSDSGSNAFITILSTGAYRVKGQVNELEAQSLIEGEPIIVRSRVDESQTWRGSMGTVDRENAVSDNSNSMYYGMMDTGSSQTTSSSYPFYVELDSSEGLMLGQHVYIELDNGQEDQKDGLWLSEFYIVDADTPDPYVWAVDDKDRLEKRSVILGNYDEDLCEYEIVDGITLKDYLAYPSDSLEEGMSTTTSESALMNTDDPLTMEENTMDDYGDTEGIEMIEDPDSLPADGEIMEGDFEGAEMIEPEMEGDFFEEELEPVDEGFEEYGGDMIEEDVTFDDAEDLE
ncbi:MAG: efflux RND transporter periplasmic adaptor subunit [Blautia sp.]|nr:efflux RND transporter periplasmic adaptor subunit [Blautia sp.]MDY3999169.1 efflux RND transporter periplasmic adaptor subunit [Blautia sp.]